MDRMNEWIGRNVAALKIGGALVLAAALGFIAIGMARAEGVDKAGKGATLAPVAEISKGSWTGPYAFGAVGYSWTRTDFETWSADKHLDANAASISGGIGYDWQVANMVFGLLADVSFSNLDAAWKGKSALDANGEWFIGARIGFLPAPATLVYGLIGYTEAIDGHLGFKAGQDIGSLAGLTYGGGVEHILGAGWAFKAEYRYVQLGDDTAPLGVKDGIKDGTGIDTASHSVRLGVVKRW